MNPNSEDILLWPDGEWCHRYELEEMLATGRSDDFRVVPVDSVEYNNLVRSVGDDQP